MEASEKKNNTLMIIKSAAADFCELTGILSKYFNIVYMSADDYGKTEPNPVITADVLIADAKITGSGFFVMLRRILTERLCHNIPVIAVSGCGDAESKKNALINGAVCVLTPPFDNETVVLCIKNIISLSPVNHDSLKERLLSEDSAVSLMEHAWKEYFKNTEDMMFIKDINLVYVGASDAFVKMVGAENADAISGKTDFELFEDKQLAKRYISDDMKLLQNGISLESYIEPIVSRNNKPKYASTSKYAIHNDKGDIVGLYGISKNVTGSYHANEYRMVMEQSGRKFCRYIIKDHTVYMMDSENAEKSAMVSAFNGNSPSEIVKSGMVAEESVESWIRMFDAIENGEHSGSYDIALRQQSGEFRWYNIRYTGIIGTGGNPTSAIISYEDITENLEAVNAIRHQADTDGMTKLYNHSATERKIKEYLSLNSGNSCAFIILDIDDLKAVNDTHGHIYGDKTLCDFAELLTGYFGSNSVIGRLGGDEFAVFMPDIETKESAVSLMQTFEEQQHNGVKPHSVHCSAGMAFGISGKDRFETLYSHADLALYRVKRGGKNGFRVYSDDFHIDAGQ